MRNIVSHFYSAHRPNFADTRRGCVGLGCLHRVRGLPRPCACQQRTGCSPHRLCPSFADSRLVHDGHFPDGELSPGDIIKSVRLVERTANAELETIRTVPVNVIVLSQGCEIDKVAKHGKSGSLVVAAVFALGSLDRGLQGLVRKNAVRKSFYLPDFDNRMPECSIGWETIQPVELMPVWNARSAERYVCGVAENSEL